MDVASADNSHRHCQLVNDAKSFDTEWVMSEQNESTSISCRIIVSLSATLARTDIVSFDHKLVCEAAATV
jgi:hypothetical protein